VYLDRFEGQRLNSPNDLVFRKQGGLYFTDPPYGLLGQDDDPAKELDFNGVFLDSLPGSACAELIRNLVNIVTIFRQLRDIVDL
jgi:sugar lactone lactonase YvrE